VYDALGNRVSVTGQGSTRDLIWDINNPLPLLIGIDDDAGDDVAYRYGPSAAPTARGWQPHTATIDETDYLLFGDAVGSITDVVDATSGQLLWHTSYEPFGTMRDTVEVVPGAPDVGLGFTGEYTDPSTGLLHLRARDYDPATGRFTAIDPVMPDLGDPYVAAYVYANNRPGVVTDPSGACPACIDWGIDLLWNLTVDNLPTKQDLTLGTTTGVVRAAERMVTGLTPFSSAEFNEMIGWDGRMLSLRLEEAWLNAGLNPTYFCGAALVGEIGLYVTTALIGGTAGSLGGAARLSAIARTHAANAGP
jgi:RHS repeat-associated protein